MSRSGKKMRALFGPSPAVLAALVLVSGLGVFADEALASAASLPRNTSAPTISGSPVEGQKLTADTETWSGTTPITFSYHWQRCDASGGSCVGPIATGSSITLGGGSVGKTFRVKVTASNADGARSATSLATPVVTAATATTTSAATTTSTPATNGCATSGGTVPVADVSLPAQLSIDGTQINPSTVTYGTRSLTVRIHVSGCGGSVDGALVYVTAVPYGQFGIPNEQATGLGWVGDSPVHGARRVPGQQQAAAHRDVRPRHSPREERHRRHLGPPARLLPRHPRLKSRRPGSADSGRPTGRPRRERLPVERSSPATPVRLDPDRLAPIPPRAPAHPLRHRPSAARSCTRRVDSPRERPSNTSSASAAERRWESRLACSRTGTLSSALPRAHRSAAAAHPRPCRSRR